MERCWTTEMPAREDAVLVDILRRRAEETPAKEFAEFYDGTTWTYAETAQRAWGIAAAFRSELGVEHGDVLASWLPNGPEALLAWFAANSAGAAYAPLNTAYRGAILAHALTLTRAGVLVAHADLLDRLAGLDLPHLHTVVVVGGTADAAQPWRTVPWTDVASRRAAAPPRLDPPLEPWDTMSILLTSGTTGSSKAVVRTYAQYNQYTDSTFRSVGAHAEDRFYVCAPMFHGGADTPIFSMLQIGASIAVDEGFSASRFWERVRRTGSTIAWMHSAMSLFLHKQPPRPDDADNPLRLAMLAPLFPGFEYFARRHGFEVYMVYGMTEMSCVFSVLRPRDPRSLGRPADPGYEVRLVDAYDVEVPVGTPGELVVRHRIPWVVTPGYLHDAEATARAWRNGWFHTGDVFVQDEAGDFRLVDRVKDSIRRRGENVSAAEVETELLDHPDVMQAAVIGVAAELEEEILGYVVLRPESQLQPKDLHRHLAERLPYFAVPRFLAIVADLPRNVAIRVDKPRLRALGLPASAWDADAAGSRVTRERFSRSIERT